MKYKSTPFFSDIRLSPSIGAFNPSLRPEFVNNSQGYFSVKSGGPLSVLLLEFVNNSQSYCFGLRSRIRK